MRKRLAVFAMTMMLICLALTGCRNGDTQIVWSIGLEEKQLFRIEEQECSIAEARILLINYKNMYSQIYGEEIWENVSMKAELEDALKNTTLSQLAKMTCMSLLAEREGVALTESEQEDVAMAAEEYYKSLSEKEQKELEITQEQIQRLYQRYAISTKLYAQLTGGVDEEVSDGDARVVDLLQICVHSEVEAKAVEEKLENGADFKATASFYNKAQSVEVSLNRNSMPEKIIEAVFALDEGERTSCIETENGYYFFYCVSKLNREKTDANKKVIVEERAKSAFDDVYDVFIRELTTVYNSEAWEKVTLDMDDNIKTSSFFTVFETYCEELGR